MARHTISLPDETSKNLRHLSELTELKISALCNIAIKELVRRPMEVIAEAARVEKDQE